MANVDSPDGGGEHGGHVGGPSQYDGPSFLLNGNSMFRPLMELLYARLPKEMRTRSIKKTCEFLLGSTFSSVAPEAATLCNAMAWADPEETDRHLLQPLLKALEHECDAIAKAELQVTAENGTKLQLSKVQETTLSWTLGLLSSVSYHMGPQVTPYGDRITKVLQILIKCPSFKVQGSAGKVLSSLLIGICSFYPLQQYSGNPVERGDGAIDFEPFVDKFGEWDLIDSGSKAEKVPAPIWHEPSEAEITLANQLVNIFVVNPAKEILEFSNLNSSPNKAYIRSTLLGIEGVLDGARSCLPDFETSWRPSEEEKVSVVGQLGATIGFPGIRELISKAAIASSAMIHSSDVDSLQILLRLIDPTLLVGSAEFHSSDAAASSWSSDDKWLQQPSVSGFLMPDSSITWRRRRPRWVAIEKVFMNLEWKSSQAAYRWYASTKCPILPIEYLSKDYLNLLGLTVHYMLRGVSVIRITAAATVERALKRYPVLAGHVYRPVCAALAKLEGHIDFDPNLTVKDLIPTLKEAALNSPNLAAELAASGIPGKL